MKAKEELSEGAVNQDTTEATHNDSPNNKDITTIAKKVSLHNPASKYFGFSLLLAYHYVMWFIPELLPNESAFIRCNHRMDRESSWHRYRDGSVRAYTRAR